MSENLNTPPDAVSQLLASWGFAPEKAPDLAHQAALCEALRGKLSGQVVAALGLARQADVEAQLSDKPQNILTLEYLADKLPGVREEAQRILALIFGYPYLKEIDPGSVHPLMSEDAEVRRVCDELNAVLLVTPLNRPLLVFSDFAKLSLFAQQGRIERMEDPLRRTLGEQPILGLADPRRLLGGYGQAHDTAGRVMASSSQDNFWSGSMAKTDSERVLARLLDFALSVSATDLAIAPRRDATGEVTIRLYGDMIRPPRHATLTIEQNREIVRFLLSRSRAGDGGRLLAPADGQLIYKNAGSEAFIRASFIPADRFGLEHEMVSASLRLLPRTAKPIRLEELNLGPLVQKEMRKSLLRSQGLVLVAGPTNSGKSTTIAGVVGEHIKMYGIAKKRISIEDPVERYLEGIIQISAEDQYAQLIRAILRHDPDLIWIGEIRDSYTATACVRAATSGHVVLSTVHANDAVLAFRAVANYLKKESVEAGGAGATQFDLAESLSLIVAQRLVKRLCPHCRTAAKVGMFHLHELQEYLEREGLVTEDRVERCKTTLSAGVQTALPGGCPECRNTGYAGELPINEILPVTREVRGLLTQSDRQIDVAALAAHRKCTLFDSALERVAHGEAEVSSLFI